MRRALWRVLGSCVALGLAAPAVSSAQTAAAPQKTRSDAKSKSKSAQKKGQGAQKKSDTRSTLDALGSQLKSGAKVASDRMAPAWEQMERGASRTLAAARSMDEAMNGCTLEARRRFEYSSLGEYYLGRALAAEHIARLEAKDLGPDHPVTRYVSRVGQLLGFAAEALGEGNSRERVPYLPERVLENRPFPFGGYQFIVLDREAPNAFGGPGGVVMITTGLLRLLQSEDELAAVLAHEVVHVQRGHGVELTKAYMCQQAKQEQVSSLGRDLAAAAGSALGSVGADGLMALGDDGLLPVFGWVNERMQAVLEAGYPRGFELEADRIGLRYLQVLGYDPNAMLRVFERLEKASPDEEYGATHPRFEDRAQSVGPVLSAILEQTGSPEGAALARRQGRYQSEMDRLPPPPKVKPHAATTP